MIKLVGVWMNSFLPPRISRSWFGLCGTLDLIASDPSIVYSLCLVSGLGRVYRTIPQQNQELSVRAGEAVLTLGRLLQ